MLGIAVDEKYRNLAGLRLQLGCVHYVVTDGAEGMSSVSHLFRETCELYQTDPVRFRQIRDEFYEKYQREKGAEEGMRAIVTVIGKDQVGIIARVCALLSEQGVNVLDISQTILQEYFTMIMLVDTAASPIPFAQLVKLLEEEGKAQGLVIHAQREDIFNAMHRI